MSYGIDWTEEQVTICELMESNESGIMEVVEMKKYIREEYWQQRVRDAFKNIREELCICGVKSLHSYIPTQDYCHICRVIDERKKEIGL